MAMNWTGPDQDPALWNEWGRLRTVSPSITSVHSSYQAFSAGAFDVIYSVSVIEHLLAALRCQWLRQMSQQLEFLEGTLLLTVDLQPTTRLLWNYSEGQGQRRGAHGTLDDLERDWCCRCPVEDVEVHFLAALLTRALRSSRRLAVRSRTTTVTSR